MKKCFTIILITVALLFCQIIFADGLKDWIQYTHDCYQYELQQLVYRGQVCEKLITKASLCAKRDLTTFMDAPYELCELNKRAQELLEQLGNTDDDFFEVYKPRISENWHEKFYDCSIELDEKFFNLASELKIFEDNKDIRDAGYEGLLRELAQKIRDGGIDRTIVLKAETNFLHSMLVVLTQVGKMIDAQFLSYLECA